MVLEDSRDVLGIDNIPRPLMLSLTKELELVENIFIHQDEAGRKKLASLSQSQYEKLNMPVSMISTPIRSNILRVGNLRLKLTVNQQGVLQKVAVFHKDYRTTVAGKPVNSEHEYYSKEFVDKDVNNIIVDQKGVQRLTKSDGSTYENWRVEKGVESCDLLTSPDGVTYKKWRLENGVETCELLTMPNGDTYENWHYENGVESCELLTMPNGETYENWRA